MKKSSQSIVEVSRHGAVQKVRLADEKTRNSLTAEMRAGLAKALQLAANDSRIRVLYLTGSGPSFSSGGDLTMLKTQNSPWEVHQRFRSFGAWFIPFLRFEKPVIVGLNGYAVGGGMGLALGGDLLIAAESAKLMCGFFRVGVIPDAATMYTLPRLIGLSRAKKLLFNNATLTAREALELGLVSEVVADSELDNVCMAAAQKLAQGPTKVMGLAKLLMARSFETDLNQMFLFEGLGQSLAMSSDEFREGITALIEKRPAVFHRDTASHPRSKTGRRRT